MTGTRALVQRPHRKMHLAVLAPDAASWTTFCDLTVAADGAEVWLYDAVGGATGHLVSQLHGIIAERPAGALCAHCRRFVLLISLLRHDALHGPAYEYGLTA